MLASSCEGFMGECRIGTCKGSFVCNKKACPFIRTSQFQQPNKVSWRNICGNLNFKVCAIYDHVAQCIYCGAKKLVEYNYTTWIATVYHLGTQNAGHRYHPGPLHVFNTQQLSHSRLLAQLKKLDYSYSETD